MYEEHNMQHGCWWINKSDHKAVALLSKIVPSSPQLDLIFVNSLYKTRSLETFHDFIAPLKAWSLI